MGFFHSQLYFIIQDGCWSSSYYILILGIRKEGTWKKSMSPPCKETLHKSHTHTHTHTQIISFMCHSMKLSYMQKDLLIEEG